ncbi:MAG: squalene--hopene cyclase [Planctomycetota bacterium]|nr:MAG: squalene--hopene cyclase [Planctomycetota bacterium]
MNPFAHRIGAVACATLIAGTVTAAEPGTGPQPVTLETAVAPEANTPDEPLAETFSLAQGKHFLDSASLAWQKQRDCMTCHTNYLYLLSRPALGVDDEAHRTVRKYAEDLVTERWPDQGPRWDTEVAMAAMVLAYNDALTTKRLHPTSRQALDRMWTVQRDDGGIDWIQCDWPPFESDDEFGATMMALAVSVAPQSYAETPQAQAGIAKLKQYFAATPPPTLHHRAMLLWADIFRPGWLSEDERTACLDELLALQHDDGSFSIAALGDWQRADDTPQDVATGDGYATGLIVFLARRAGIPASDERLVHGVTWLKDNQRESGRWFTRSLHKDSKHYITHAGTSMALMALAACDALE